MNLDQLAAHVMEIKHILASVTFRRKRSSSLELSDEFGGRLDFLTTIGVAAIASISSAISRRSVSPSSVSSIISMAWTGSTLRAVLAGGPILSFPFPFPFPFTTPGPRTGGCLVLALGGGGSTASGSSSPDVTFTCSTSSISGASSER